MNRFILASLAMVSLVALTAAEPHKYTSYDYADTAKKAKLRLVIPEGLNVVRGILVVPPFSGGDTRDFHNQVWYREFLHLHGFAFLGADWTGPHAERFTVFQSALKQFAAESKHTELVHVPYVATGFSAGGGFANRLLLEVPDKLIAAVIVGSRPNVKDIPPTDAHRGVPLLIMNGEDEENGMAATVEPILAEHRPKGAHWGGCPSPASATNATPRKCSRCRCSMPRSDSATPPTATSERVP